MQKLVKSSNDNIDTAAVVASLEKEAKPLFSKLQKVEAIRDVDTLEKASNSLKALKEIKKMAEVRHADLVSDIKEAVKKLKASEKKHAAFFQPFYTKVASVEENIKLAIAEFYTWQETERKKLETKAANGKVSVAKYAEKSAELNIGKVGAAVKVTTYVVSIVDASKIPRKYLVPDEYAIKMALGEGIKVPGCELKKVEKARI